MSYKVIKGFYDLEDGKQTKSETIYHYYEEGDPYPRSGIKPSKERIDALSGSNNAQGCPLIKKSSGSKKKG